MKVLRTLTTGGPPSCGSDKVSVIGWMPPAAPGGSVAASTSPSLKLQDRGTGDRQALKPRDIELVARLGFILIRQVRAVDVLDCAAVDDTGEHAAVAHDVHHDIAGVDAGGATDAFVLQALRMSGSGIEAVTAAAESGNVIWRAPSPRTLRYRTVQAHATWLVLQDDGTGGVAPSVIEREFRRYLSTVASSPKALPVPAVPTVATISWLMKHPEAWHARPTNVRGTWGGA